LYHNHVGKPFPQPLLLPNKTQKPTQTKNKTQYTTALKAYAHKTPTTTTKRKPVRHTEHLCRFFLLKPLRLQLPTWKKPVYFYNNNQTNPKNQPKQKQTLNNNQKKTHVHTKQSNNNQKEKLKNLYMESSIRKSLFQKAPNKEY
jgi:flagellar hook protein FlgE